MRIGGSGRASARPTASPHAGRSTGENYRPASVARLVSAGRNVFAIATVIRSYVDANSSGYDIENAFTAAPSCLAMK